MSMRLERAPSKAVAKRAVETQPLKLLADVRDLMPSARDLGAHGGWGGDFADSVGKIASRIRPRLQPAESGANTSVSMEPQSGGALSGLAGTCHERSMER